jgi:hypothetical protein
MDDHPAHSQEAATRFGSLTAWVLLGRVFVLVDDAFGAQTVIVLNLPFVGETDFQLFKISHAVLVNEEVGELQSVVSDLSFQTG